MFPSQHNRERLRRNFKSFIDRRVTSHVNSFYVGRIVKYIPGDNLIIRLVDIEGNIEISWRDKLLRIFTTDILEEGKNVVLVYYKGIFILLGVLRDELEIEELPEGLSLLAETGDSLMPARRNHEHPVEGQVIINAIDSVIGSSWRT